MADAVPAQKAPYMVRVEGGRSGTQPFCDGSHSGTGLLPVPYKAKETKDVWFCGCKATAKKPFCDGTHNSL